MREMTLSVFVAAANAFQQLMVFPHGWLDTATIYPGSGRIKSIEARTGSLTLSDLVESIEIYEARALNGKLVPSLTVSAGTISAVAPINCSMAVSMFIYPSAVPRSPLESHCRHTAPPPLRRPV